MNSKEENSLDFCLDFVQEFGLSAVQILHDLRISEKTIYLSSSKNVYIKGYTRVLHTNSLDEFGGMLQTRRSHTKNKEKHGSVVLPVFAAAMVRRQETEAIM